MDRKKARNWYWWTWLSPLLTIPTLVFIALASYFILDFNELPAAILATIVSAAWHLFLLIPLNNKESSFVRWHGKQMLALAGLQIITLFSLLLSLVYDESLIIIAGVIGLTWFFGTLFGQFQAARGDCSLMRWFGHEDELKALATETQVDEAAGLDSDAMVDIIRFSRDSEERRKALKELDSLGMVAVLGDTPVHIPSPIKSAAVYPKVPPKKKNQIKRWIISGLFVLFIGGMMAGGYLIRNQKKDKALDWISMGVSVASTGNIDYALNYFSKAQELDPYVEITNGDWNTICWFGSLWGYAEDVLDACEKAVSLTPAIGYSAGAIRDSRGLARALLGDYEGAIEDFEFFLEQYKKEGICDEDCLRREKWIDALAAGINPFDAQLLEDLKN